MSVRAACGEIEIPRATQHDYYEASSHGVVLNSERRSGGGGVGGGVGVKKKIKQKKKTMEEMTSNARFICVRVLPYSWLYITRGRV